MRRQIATLPKSQLIALIEDAGPYLAELDRRRWPGAYVSARSGKEYRPHNEDEAAFVFDDVPRHSLLKGGEGAGKSVAGIVKVLDRLRRGCDGAMTSPDLEHFKKSLWPEFRTWCPWDKVVGEHRRMAAETWEPHHAFFVTFHAEDGGLARLDCGGMKEPESWEGPNLNFWHMDEARHFKKAAALKVAAGRTRIAGPRGEPPQIFLTTTPRKHWMYDYFGPARDGDPYADFKRESFVGTVPVWLNADNLAPGYLEQRGQVLNESERRVLMDAEWEDEAPADKFLASMLWWDRCHHRDGEGNLAPLPALQPNEPVVLALDAAKGGATSTADCFAIVGVTRHPERKADVAVRYVGVWKPLPGKLLDFGPIEEEVRRLCNSFAVAAVCYDPFQLHHFCQGLYREGVALFKEFKQGQNRLVADKQLLDLILSRRLAHDGDPVLRQHVDNADVKKSGAGMRLTKRTASLKIDAAVALSMAAAECLRLNL